MERERIIPIGKIHIFLAYHPILTVPSSYFDSAFIRGQLNDLLIIVAVLYTLIIWELCGLSGARI
jgi:hypothetical protein